MIGDLGAREHLSDPLKIGREPPIHGPMSLEAAIGRIGQIIQLQQQIVDPTAPTAGASTSALTESGGAPASTAGASFADMLSGAQTTSTQDTAIPGDETTDLTSAALGDTSDTALTDPTASDTALADPISSGVADPILGTSGVSGAAGLTSPGLTGLSPTGLTTATGAPPVQVQQMVDQANALLGKPYVWGGGHGDFGPQAGYDCSGFVSSVLHAGGYLSSPQDTQTLPDQPGIEDGPGQYVTIYDRTDAGSGQDHVIIDLGGQFYESGGGHGAWGGGGGVEKIGTPSASYLASFNRVLHPEGL
jgi:cell wall-associated NlpC family hydrolase